MRVWLAAAAVILVIISTVSADPSPDPNPEPAPAPAPAPSAKAEECDEPADTPPEGNTNVVAEKDPVKKPSSKPKPASKKAPVKKPSSKPKPPAKKVKKPNSKPKPPAKKAPVKKPSSKPKPPAKKVLVKKPNSKPKPPAKKAPVKKPSSKPKPPAKKAPVKKPSSKPKPPAKKAPVKKPNSKPHPPAKKAPVKKPSSKPKLPAKKAPVKKPNSKPQPPAKKAPVKKPHSKPKPPAKKAPEKKPNSKPKPPAKKAPETKQNTKTKKAVHKVPIPKEPVAKNKKEAVRCRRGFWPVGSMCYKIIREKSDWQSAALYCGAHGAGLARYDSDADKSLKDFFFMMTRFLYSAKKETCDDKHKDCAARAARNECQKKPHWMVPNCRKACGMCKTTRPLSTWVGGNTKVLDYGKRVDKTPLQVDPPRNFKKNRTKGCYRAYRTKCGKFWLEPMSNCDQKQEFICSYDNTAGYKYEKCENKDPKCEERAAAGECKKNPGKMIATCRLACDKCERGFTPEYDPFNFVIMETEVTYSEAIIKCNSMNRPVASIMTAEQQAIVERIVKKKGKHAWISATYDANRKAFRWAGNYFVDYSNWHDTVVRNTVGWRNTHCTGVNAQTGKWLTFRCGDKRPAVCGPPGTCVNKHKDCVSRAQKGECQKNPKFMIPNCRLACGKCDVDKPLKFTPYYPTNGVRSIRILKEKFRRLQQKDMVCEKPRTMECIAKANKGDNWINNNNQKSDTIKCNENEISCKSGRELDCKTLRVRFLCPQEVDQCSELKKYGGACSGGRQCFPAPNHFHCRCPPNYMWSKGSKKCVKFCGECNAWGDPHYTTLNGLKYDFMGTCRYKFNGVCKQKDFGNKPNYDIYTENVACSNEWRRDGTCLKAVEIHLRQITINKKKRNFVFRVVVGDKGYTIDGKRVTDMVKVQNGVYSASVRPSYFSLEVYPLNLKILLNGNHLRTRVPDMFRGKLCGLCGDCGTDRFTLRNGTKVSIPHKNGEYPEEPMRHVGLNWMENTPQFKGKKCGAEKSTDKCTLKQKIKVKEDSLCGIFKQTKGPIKDCIDKAKLDGKKFFVDCIFDLCEMGDPNKAVCGIVSAFAQQCLSKGVPIDWRKPSFCPMKCPKDMVYRVDASCQKTCKRRSGKKDCGEEPAEGCVCKDGLYRLGDRCVTKCDCPD